jgi:hypothetical protein
MVGAIDIPQTNYSNIFSWWPFPIISFLFWLHFPCVARENGEEFPNSTTE